MSGHAKLCPNILKLEGFPWRLMMKSKTTKELKDLIINATNELASRVNDVTHRSIPSVDWSGFECVMENCKTKPFNSVFEDHERDAVSYLVDTFLSEGYTDLRLLAYALATVRIECGSKMMPVREGFVATDAQARKHVERYHRKYATEINGHVYYGRGYVQLTWYENYKKEGIQSNPDKALEPEFAAKLLFKGLLDGRWNGQAKGLMHYLDKGDVFNARRTVNVTNKAQMVANWYYDFLEACENAIEF